MGKKRKTVIVTHTIIFGKSDSWKFPGKIMGASTAFGPYTVDLQYRQQISACASYARALELGVQAGARITIR